MVTIGPFQKLKAIHFPKKGNFMIAGRNPDDGTTGAFGATDGDGHPITFGTIVFGFESTDLSFTVAVIASLGDGVQLEIHVTGDVRTAFSGRSVVIPEYGTYAFDDATSTDFLGGATVYGWFDLGGIPPFIDGHRYSPLSITGLGMPTS